jgi:hypothetical protein
MNIYLIGSVIIVSILIGYFVLAWRRNVAAQVGTKEYVAAEIPHVVQNLTGLTAIVQSLVSITLSIGFGLMLGVGVILSVSLGVLMGCNSVVEFYMSFYIRRFWTTKELPNFLASLLMLGMTIALSVLAVQGSLTYSSKASSGVSKEIEKLESSIERLQKQIDVCPNGERYPTKYLRCTEPLQKRQIVFEEDLRNLKAGSTTSVGGNNGGNAGIESLALVLGVSSNLIGGIIWLVLSVYNELSIVFLFFLWGTTSTSSVYKVALNQSNPNLAAKVVLQDVGRKINFSNNDSVKQKVKDALNAGDISLQEDDVYTFLKNNKLEYDGEIEELIKELASSFRRTYI